VRREFGTLAGLLVLCMALWIATPHFLTTANLLNVVEQSTLIGIIAVGMTFVILTAGIDLSVGSIVALSGVAMGTAFRAGLPIFAAALTGLAVGLACGLANGALITLGRLPPFIATLGMMSIARGGALMLSDGRPISGYSDGFRALATGDLLGIPLPVVIMLAIYGIAHFVLSRTTLGRYTYAIGGNEEAAELSGIRVRAYKSAVYGIAGLLSAVTSILLVARLDSAQPIAGIMYELDAIAAVVIGGTLLTGGVGYVVGTLFGVMMLGIIQTLIAFDGTLSSWWTRIVVGALLRTMSD